MFVDRTGISEREYLCLMMLLGEGGMEYTFPFVDVLKMLTEWMPRNSVIESFNILGEKRLVNFYKGEYRPYVLDLDGSVGLTSHGFAFLINYANDYLDRVNEAYFGMIPDGLFAGLIPFLNLQSVPAADRFVKTTDNLGDFQKLEKELETVRQEIIKDANKDELPIADKKAALSDIDAVLAQIKDGMVRLSDLTNRIRPVIKNIADLCKDFVVIAGAASAAYLTIASILSKIF